MKNELGTIVKCCSKVLAVTNKGKTINPQLNEKAWESMAMQIKSLSQRLINQGISGEANEIVTIAKLMDIKDSLYAQMFEALLYKKTLLYEDLDLNNHVATEESNIIYMSEKVVQMHEKLQNLQATKGCLPGKIDFIPITDESTGLFQTFGVSEGSEIGSGETESSKWMMAFTEAYVDLEELVKKNWIFSEEKIKGFMETNPVQRSLREQVEFLVDANHLLQKRFDDLVAD